MDNTNEIWLEKFKESLTPADIKFKVSFPADTYEDFSYITITFKTFKEAEMFVDKIIALAEVDNVRGAINQGDLDYDLYERIGGLDGDIRNIKISACLTAKSAPVYQLFPDRFAK